MNDCCREIKNAQKHRKGRVHTTHFDDCGCLSAKYESRLIAEREEERNKNALCGSGECCREYVEEARIAERERAARIAETFPYAATQHTDYQLQTAIAAKIREGA